MTEMDRWNLILSDEPCDCHVLNGDENWHNYDCRYLDEYLAVAL